MILAYMAYGFLIASVFSLICCAIIPKSDDELTNKQETILIIIFIVVWIISIVIGCYIENQKLKVETEQYRAVKETIETSLQSDKLTGLERIELVKQASEQNAWLKGTQYKVQQWYNFYLSKDILEVEIINIKE